MKTDKKNRKTKRLRYFKDLVGYMITKDDPDMRGWAVHDANMDKVGIVAGQLIDTESQRFICIDVELLDDNAPSDYDIAMQDEDIQQYKGKKGKIHMMIPVEAVHIDYANKCVVAEGIDDGALRSFPSYVYKENASLNLRYERRVLQEYMKQKRYRKRSGANAVNRAFSDEKDQLMKVE